MPKRQVILCMARPDRPPGTVETSSGQLFSAVDWARWGHPENPGPDAPQREPEPPTETNQGEPRAPTDQRAPMEQKSTTKGPTQDGSQTETKPQEKALRGRGRGRRISTRPTSSHYAQVLHQGSAGKTGRLLLLQPRLVNKLIMREATPRMILPITTTKLAALMGAVLPIRQYLTKATARLLLPCSKG